MYWQCKGSCRMYDVWQHSVMLQYIVDRNTVCMCVLGSLPFNRLLIFYSIQLVCIFWVRDSFRKHGISCDCCVGLSNWAADCGQRPVFGNGKAAAATAGSTVEIGLNITVRMYNIHTTFRRYVLPVPCIFYCIQICSLTAVF